MSHRTQIILEDEQYARLKDEAVRTGLGLGELVRRALDEKYARGGADERSRKLDLSFGAWDVEVDGEQYVEGLRAGLGRRLGDA
jgi:hypothetical protein